MAIRIPNLLPIFPAHIRPYIVLLSACLIHLTLGTLYCIGNLIPYIASYLRFSKGQDVSIGSMSWFGALTAAAQGASMFVGGLIEHRIGTQIAIFTGCFLVVFGVAMTYFAVQSGVAAAYITYGIIFGSGIGITYAPCIACAIRWLPQRKGLVTGCVVAGFGLGAFVFNYVATYYVNPHNLPTNKNIDGTRYFKQPDIQERTPSVFLVLAACYAGLQLIGLLFITNPEAGVEILEENTVESYSPVQMLKTQTFYSIWFLFFTNAGMIGFLTVYWKEFGETFIDDDHFLSLIGSIASVANAIGRIFWGYLGDTFSYQVAMSCVCAVFSALYFTFLLCSKAHKAMYFIWVVVAFFTLSGNFALHPMVTAKVYGRGYFATNYGIVFTSSMVASLIFAGIQTAALDFLGYMGFFFLFGILGCVGSSLAMTIHLTDCGKYIEPKDQPYPSIE